MVGKAAGFASVLAKGVKGYAEGYSERDAAKVRKAEGEAKLAKLTYTKETGAVETQLDALTAQNQELLRANQQNQTYRALDAYTADSDPRHLNALIQHPMMKDKFPDLVSLDKVDAINDKAFVSKTGFNPEIFTTDTNASERYLKATMQDGSKKLIDMLTIYAGTGYTRMLDNRKLTDLLTKAKIKKTVGVSKPTKLERDARLVAQAEERIKEAETKGKTPNPEDVMIAKFGQKELAGVRPGQLGAAEDRTTQLVKKFGGEDQFFKTDFGDVTNFRKAYSDIAAIERLENVEYTSKEKTDLNDIRVLISMGDPARNLTDEETGIYDNTFLKAKKYLSDNVEGVAAASAYAAFRNTVRHALFGSALTEAEIKSNNEAFGTLGQKLGPVLQQFKTALTQVKAKLNSIARMKNPYSAHVRLGVDEQRMDQILSSIDQRIESLDTLDTGETSQPTTKLKGFGGKQ